MDSSAIQIYLAQKNCVFLWQTHHGWHPQKKDLEAAECGMPDDGIAPPRKFLLCQGVASLSVLPCSALVFFQI